MESDVTLDEHLHTIDAGVRMPEVAAKFLLLYEQEDNYEGK